MLSLGWRGLWRASHVLTHFPGGRVFDLLNAILPTGCLMRDKTALRRRNATRRYRNAYSRYKDTVGSGELQAMAAKGFNEHDVDRALDISQKMGIDVNLVIKAKHESIDWGVTEALLRYITR